MPHEFMLQVSNPSRPATVFLTYVFAGLLELQAVSYTLPHALLELWCVLSPQGSSFYIRWRLVVRAREH